MLVTPTNPEAPTPTAERRIAPRRQPAMGAVCRLDSADGGPSPIALVWNISATGISVLFHEPRPAGTMLYGYLELMAGDTLLPIAMTVVHVKKLDTGDFFIGGHFEKPLSAEQLKPFVAE